MSHISSPDIQSFFTQPILSCDFLGRGCSNDAYLVRTDDGKECVAKRAGEIPEHRAQNTLFTEAKLLQFLAQKSLGIRIPEIIFLSEYPDMYGYVYIPGSLLTKIWEGLTHLEKITLCQGLGRFHADLAQSMTLGESQYLGLKYDPSCDLHPETLEGLIKIHTDPEIPTTIKTPALEMKNILDTTYSETFFHCLHGDAHHENILVENVKITGIIDFGETEYGEVAKEFSRYIRDFPDYWEHIVTRYEAASGNILSRKRLISYSFLAGLIDNIEMWKQGGTEREKAERNIEWYREVMRGIL